MKSAASMTVVPSLIRRSGICSENIFPSNLAMSPVDAQLVASQTFFYFW
jgi:hypothetical protein